FRPYAPAVLEEKALEYFDLKQRSPFMLLAAKVKNDKRHLIPGVTHVDGTARIQTVSKNENPKFWNLIKEFENIIGIPVVLNTSFNLHNEPIVCTPEDAISSFKSSEMDYLVMGNYIVSKRDI
ncbi:carbamoyl transferase, partial [bacterium]|nr:carbamoyl transferase [bacterium]